MAPNARPCRYFQLGKCDKGANCDFAHVRDPNFKPKPCQYFMKGMCRRGASCTYSHDTDNINHLRIANNAAGTWGSAPENSEQLLRDFRYKIPQMTADVRPLGYGLGTFFEQALKLVDGEVGTMQEVVTLLSSEGGLKRIEEPEVERGLP